MRIVQPRGTKGSLKWVQTLVAGNPAQLTDAVRASFKLGIDWTVNWVSPLPSDEWAEYRDRDFLAVLGVGDVATALEAFWPPRGPQWDALGRSSDGGVVLVEAKSHPAELRSSCQASGKSLTLIETSLSKAKRGYAVEPTVNWTSPYYQHANRLAHRWFLGGQGMTARLVFVYFLNDVEMDGPVSQREWRTFLNNVYSDLGLPAETLQEVCNVFIDVRTLEPSILL